jgi:TRAP-type mannitol/chloroaromatic compound transport system permease small subunit
MLLAAAVGFFVYLLIFVLGMSFAKQGMMHVVVDILWQMFEQSMGGLMVSLGMIYDMHKRFLDQERGS